MAEAGLCIAWGDAVKGTEKRALEAYGESMQYFGRLQEEGRIERVEVVVLGPTGGDMGGSGCCGARRSRSTRFAVPRSMCG